MANAIMKNTLGELSFYRKKSIMILDLSVNVAYNIANPMISIRFAERQDEKSKGKWETENTFYFTSYPAILDFAAKFKSVVMGQNGKDVNFSNPAKGKGIFVKKSVADEGTPKEKTYISNIFFIGSKDDGKKISVSLSVDEANSIIAFLTSCITNYANVAQLALNRYDFWYSKFGSASKEPSQKSSQSTPTKDDHKMMQEIEQEMQGTGGFSGSEDAPF